MMVKTCINWRSCRQCNK